MMVLSILIIVCLILHLGFGKSWGTRFVCMHENGQLTTFHALRDRIPTPPAYADPLLPCWGSVTPFAVPAIPGGGILNAKNVSDDSDDDSSIDDLDGTAGPFAVTKAPPALGSNRYASELLEVQSLGAIDSRTRTEDQTNVAKFWAQNAGTSTPPGMWQDIASQILAQRAAAGHPYPLVDQARLYAVLTAAQADAAISCWWSKYQFWRWRPITAIQQANSSLNKRMPAANPTWQPLLPTPPFPTYTSGHSTFSGASAQVLADFFGSDVASFTVTTEWPGVPPRTFRSFSEAADEAGMSRIYGGIHFDRDNVPALKVGRKIGRYAFKRVMKPLRN